MVLALASEVSQALTARMVSHQAPSNPVGSSRETLKKVTGHCWWRSGPAGTPYGDPQGSGVGAHEDARMRIHSRGQLRRTHCIHFIAELAK